MVRELCAVPLLQFIVYSILAGLILGVLAALKRGDFSFALLGDWLKDKVLYLLLPYLVVWVLAQGVGGPFSAMAPVAAATVELTLLSSIYNALRDLGLDGWLPESRLISVIPRGAVGLQSETRN